MNGAVADRLCRRISFGFWSNHQPGVCLSKLILRIRKVKNTTVVAHDLLDHVYIVTLATLESNPQDSQARFTLLLISIIFHRISIAPLRST